MAASGGERSLKETPTWAVAVVCAVFVILSVLIEYGIHSLGKFFLKRKKKAMTEALEKIKAELMLLGFLSLLLTVGTQPISKICMPTKYGDYMLPCQKEKNYYGVKNDEGGYSSGDSNVNDRRKLLMYLGEDVVWRRALAADAGAGGYCVGKNKIPLISQTAVHQLHIFIFVLAFFHVLYSVITMALGQAKMKKWKSWELESSSLEYQFTNDPARFRFTNQTSFVRRHTGFSRAPGLRWIVAFFRQFFGSVTKVDYLTMRHGFINAHLSQNSKFDFHKYIKRSMEDDFKVVVGISTPLWIFVIIFMLLNVYKWYTFSWLSFIPLIILLLIGMKLEVIIMEMADQIQERNSVIKGVPVVEPSNKLFWFNSPKSILFLLHFTLFQNAFQMAYFLWISVRERLLTVSYILSHACPGSFIENCHYEFGLKSCFHENLPAILIRVILGVAIHILLSYITFPLYALVTQMGSHMKQAIFEEQTAMALKKWQKAAKDRKKLRKAGEGIDISMSGESTPNIGSSPIHLLHKYKSNTGDIESILNSPRSYQSETDFSEPEPPTPVSHEPMRHYHPSRDTDVHIHDFSFDKPER
ncbi:hypothetical protein GIB67_026761 [Kingdonia uniflora]|uniref:MLO-like protein n=1 Tax=Kingdonia uniflora TaxID=39325 RepID=A0A7J7MHA7_9MAGN|nr:hypothetical protein GIB67_026761 [Kingdonia uniflora]